MTDKECYEIMLKYTDENALAKQKIMLHSVGVEATMKYVIAAYEQNGTEVPEDFKTWMRQSMNYILQTDAEKN